MFKSVIAMVLLVVLSGCQSLAAEKGCAAGLASYYRDKYHGHYASGVLSKHRTAHRNLPFGSKVKVTNINNGRSVVVRINDEAFV